MNYNDENLLEIVEMYAEEMGYISSEEDLSERFDNEVLPGIIEQYGEKGVEFEDTTRINEDFNNWADGLCKDGEIHPEQVRNYCYVGKLAD